jgi:Xaa-Pro aminopeptidase
LQPDIGIHRARRAHLIKAMGEGVLILATAPEAIRNRDAHYPYRFDSHFYYLTAFPEPEAVLVLIAGRNGRRSRHILFCREKNPEREIWDGFRYGPQAAKELFALVKKKKIKIQIGQRYPLEKAAQAHIDLEARKTVGSTILVP